MAEQEGRLAYSVPDACDQLSIGRSTFYELVQRGELRTFKIGSKTLVSRTELVRLVAVKTGEVA